MVQRRRSPSRVLAAALVVSATAALLSGSPSAVGQSARQPDERYNRDGLRAVTVVAGHGPSSSLDASVSTIQGVLRTVSWRAAGDLVVQRPGVAAGTRVGVLNLSGRRRATYVLRVPSRRSGALVLLRSGSVRVVLRPISSPGRSTVFLTVSGLAAGTSGAGVVLRRGAVRLSRAGCPVRARFRAYVIRAQAAPGTADTRQGC